MIFGRKKSVLERTLDWALKTKKPETPAELHVILQEHGWDFTSSWETTSNRFTEGEKVRIYHWDRQHLVDFEIFAEFGLQTGRLAIDKVPKRRKIV